ncbi:MAG TPA: zinc-binding alcohol dehydrogenase family protein [Tepidisphaeraceae bacterium]|jgi:NADPH2:quinone reductase|nr:zinc-binding alcohol dehydrogenase family protein [Tepidisphaeraceae bacterium]
MRAWLLQSLGGLEKLKLEDAPDPQPADGEAVIRVLYAGLNPADRYLTEGQYPARPTFPHILGRDGIGIVESLGKNAGDFKVGEKVALVRSEIGVNRAGTFAERVAVPVESLVRPPPDWSDQESAGATLVYLTAFQAITQWPDLPGQGVVLISGASGGVGVATVHLAKAMGHTVIGLSRSAEKSEKLRQLGADALFDPNDTQLRRRIKEFLKDRRVDLAIDNIGGSLFSQMIDVLAENGRVSCVGRLAGPVPQFNTATLFFRRIQIRGVTISAYTASQSCQHWIEIVRILKQSGARPIVDSVFPFDRLLDAFERLHAGPMGKVLLRVTGS